MNPLARLRSPVLLAGDAHNAFRDPAVVWHDGRFFLFFTWVRIEENGAVRMYLGLAESEDLVRFSPPVRLTPRDPAKNFSSPGNVIRHDGRWVLCLQTYPRPRGEKYANADARLWTMASDDLRLWSEPELLRVKGPEVPEADMGRMIDPYLLEDRRAPGKYWCFYKQEGANLSWSRDLRRWTPHSRIDAGENVCVVPDGAGYRMFHSPANGIGMLVSDDLAVWRPDGGLITLGQKDWPWARGRLTAGFVLDGRDIPGIGKYLLFFHGTGPEDESVVFDTHACIGVAWSDDLRQWSWPDRNGQ